MRTPDPANHAHGDHSDPLLHKNAAGWVAHLAQFWVGTTLKNGSVFGRRQQHQHK
jgi:hypothetical protein